MADVPRAVSQMLGEPLGNGLLAHLGVSIVRHLPSHHVFKLAIEGHNPVPGVARFFPGSEGEVADLDHFDHVLAF